MADSEEGNSSARESQNAAQGLPRFVCVEFPARVQNVDKMLKTLGGEETISNIFTAGSNKKLGMKFRPDDPFSRPLYASRHQATNLLLRVKKRYKKKAGSEGNEAQEDDECTDDVIVDEEAEYKTELVGVLDSVYKFKGLCDFQYLPIHKNKETNKMESLTDTIIPKEPKDTTFLQQDVPHFMLPPVFSRTDIPSSYNYQPDLLPASESITYKVANTLDANITGSGRARRPHNTYVVSFEEEKDLPTAPKPEALINIEKYTEKNKDIKIMMEEIVQVFQKRPIWSRNALKHNCTLTDPQLKVLLPAVGFYYLTGPWRATWVRFGYDPRKDPGALKYQMLDFRIRKAMFLSRSTSSSRKHYNRFKKTSYERQLPMSIQKPSRRSQAFIKYNETTSPGAEAKKTVDKESYFLFKEGLVPAYNQMFYQLCDIKDDGLQAFIKGATSENDCYLKTEDLCQLRSLMNAILKRTLIQEEKSRAAKEEGETPGPSSASPIGEVDLDDQEMEGVDEEDDEEEEDSGDDAENDDEPIDDANIDGEEESENEMETDILEYLSGT
ncbi:general transcription factor 3C polypeptide 5-like isoform X1 [Asterias amurensis]|uniref:general transcription factor 3C polypeptide 5-like isoform X1 n=2 Tax=Asterias amurensis TaxID=7602 RepID=UPI003AB81135